MTSNSDIPSAKTTMDNSKKKKKGKEGPKWRDASYKLLYTFPEMVSDLLTGFIPEELIGQIDSSTLKREPDTFINKHLSERREDRIWSVRTTQGSTLYLYLLFEFQSANSEEMALRMLEYAAVFLVDLYHRKVLNHGEKHWPILPIVMYTGSSPWTAPLACSGHRVPTFSSLLQFQPEMEYFLLDIPRIAKESLADEKNLSALLFRLEQCKSLDEVQAEVRKAKIRLKGEHYEEFRLILADWLWNTVITKFTTENPIKKDLDLEEVDTMLDETMEKIRDNMLRIREKDIEDAKSEGKIEKSKEIAKKMLDLNEALEKIIQLTDLSKQDILALKSEKAKA